MKKDIFPFPPISLPDSNYWLTPPVPQRILLSGCCSLWVLPESLCPEHSTKSRVLTASATLYVIISSALMEMEEWVDFAERVP